MSSCTAAPNGSCAAPVAVRACLPGSPQSAISKPDAPSMTFGWSANSAAGLQNLLRTLSGAVGTSFVTTVWEDKTNYAHAELAGLADREGEAMRTLTGSGMSHDQALASLNQLVDGQSVTIATNQVMMLITLSFTFAAFVIWLAPKPARAVDMTQAGH